MSNDYVSITLPKKFVIKIIDPIVQNQEMGFSSRADVVKTAVRQYAKGLNINENEEKKEDEI